MSAVDQAAPELLPCPFCGSVEMLRRVGEIESDGWGFVRCDYCDAEGPGPASLPGHWNHRADLAAPSAPAEEHVCALNRVKGGHCFVCGSIDAAMQAEQQAKDEYHQAIADLNRMTDRGELPPSAPAEVEGLTDAQKIERMADLNWKPASAYWKEQHDAKAAALTALQAEIERLREAADASDGNDLWRFWNSRAKAFMDRAHDLQSRAEKAETERDDWKANAETLAEAVSPFADVGVPSDPMSRINLTADREFVIAAREALAANAKLKGDV